MIEKIQAVIEGQAGFTPAELVTEDLNTGVHLRGTLNGVTVWMQTTPALGVTYVNLLSKTDWDDMYAAIIVVNGQIQVSFHNLIHHVTPLAVMMKFVEFQANAVALAQVIETAINAPAAPALETPAVADNSALQFSHIEVLWSESQHFEDHERFDTFEAFNARVRRAAEDVERGYDKTKYRVIVIPADEDGYLYEGRVDIGDSEWSNWNDFDLRVHIQGRLDYRLNSVSALYQGDNPETIQELGDIFERFKAVK